MSALLAIDVGNTNTVLGVWDGDQLLAHWRIETNAGRTADEYALVIRGLFDTRDLALSSIASGIVSSVVPPVARALSGLFEEHLNAPVMQVGPGMKTGMPVLYENPREVGADRIVNSIAAYEKHRRGCIIVDFGTATTWDVVTDKGQYLGGVIAPGVNISAQALYSHAAKLPRVDISRPPSVVGRNTVASMQSGLLYGYAGMVDALVARIIKEVDFEPVCIATGGLASLIAKEASSIEHVDEFLTLRGLRILHERNR